MNRKSVAGILAALVLFGSIYGAGLAGAVGISMDSETSSTAETSDLVEGATIANFSADSADKMYVSVDTQSTPSGDLVVEFYADGANTSSDEPFATVTGGFEVQNSTAGIYARNISHDELSTVPIDFNESKAIDVYVYEKGNAVNASTTINATLDGVENRAVLTVAEDDTDSEEKGIFNKRTVVTHDASTVTLPDNVTDRQVTYVYEGAAADDISTNAEDFESGDWMYTYAVYTDDGTPIKVFSSNAEDASDLTGIYGVQKTDDGKQTTTFHVSDDYDEDEFELKSVSGQEISFWSVFSGNGFTGLADNFDFGDLGTLASPL